MIFDRLENELDGVKHLIALVPVPFSFIRVHIAETIFERFKNLPNKWRRIPPVKQTNSIFGLPELYDDLLDEWTHRAHIEERNRVLVRLQQIAEEKKVRITYFSGDVHCCGISRFQTKGSHRPSPIHDAFHPLSSICLRPKRLFELRIVFKRNGNQWMIPKKR